MIFLHALKKLNESEYLRCLVRWMNWGLSGEACWMRCFSLAREISDHLLTWVSYHCNYPLCNKYDERFNDNLHAGSHKWWRIKLREAHKSPSPLKESSMVHGERLNYLDHVEEESQGRLTDINSPVTLWDFENSIALRAWSGMLNGVHLAFTKK